MLNSMQNVIVQGITGSQGSFHTKAMRSAGTNIVAGTSPTKAGADVDGIPVYASIKDIQEEHIVDTSVIFVPAPYAKGAILEAINAGIQTIVCITEGVPVHDMLTVKQRLRSLGDKAPTLIGPNSPGVLLPGKLRLGIIPHSMGLPGTVGIVSRSGTLTYEAMAGLTERGIGQKYVVGIGGDPIRGTSFIDCLELFENDPEVTSIVMIGEIGGTDEQAAGDYIANNVTKPVYGYIAGHAAPAGVQLGHAGAILGSDSESAGAKTTYLAGRGVSMAESITELVSLVY